MSSSIQGQTQFSIPGPLLTPTGDLAVIGWARQPYLDCNLEDAQFYALSMLQPLRIKRWDYYGIATPDHFFSFTLADLGYLCRVGAYAVDYKTGRTHEETLTLPLGGHVELPRNSREGDSHYSNGKVRIHFGVEPEARMLTVDWPGFAGQKLKVRARLRLPSDHESLTIVIPIEGKRFYYNRKVNCMPVEGIADYAGQHFQLNPRTCLATLDWGRGVWPYRSFWVWASASGFLPGGRTLGLNLGFGFGDTSAATRNAIILDGRIHKLAQVDFHYSSKDLKEPWKITSPDGRMRLEFKPFLVRAAKSNALIMKSEIRQVFGKYNGVVISDTGEEILVRDLVGFVEEHNARW